MWQGLDESIRSIKRFAKGAIHSVSKIVVNSQRVVGVS
jgi:hypothetical protein